jgi:hypothetical protein
VGRKPLERVHIVISVVIFETASLLIIRRLRMGATREHPSGSTGGRESACCVLSLSCLVGATERQMVVGDEWWLLPSQDDVRSPRQARAVLSPSRLSRLHDSTATRLHWDHCSSFLHSLPLLRLVNVLQSCRSCPSLPSLRGQAAAVSVKLFKASSGRHSWCWWRSSLWPLR